jgi:hypothetical protein
VGDAGASEDRPHCLPWLIRRFIDPNAEFIYVPKDQVLAVAKQTGGTPYDIDGVEFTHEGERCSFDTILRIYEIRDPALDHLATIVRGADTSRHDLSPQCGGLFAISRRVAQPGVVLRRQVQQAPLRELISVLSKAATAVRLRLQKRTVHFRTPRHT